MNAKLELILATLGSNSQKVKELEETNNKKIQELEEKLKRTEIDLSSINKTNTTQPEPN